MPHLQKLYDRLKDKGFDMVAVNANDPESTVLKYVQESKFSFKVVLGGQGKEYQVGKAYGVQAYPTNYLVGPDGKVLWRAVGFNESAMRAALEKAGLK